MAPLSSKNETAKLQFAMNVSIKTQQNIVKTNWLRSPFIGKRTQKERLLLLSLLLLLLNIQPTTQTSISMPYTTTYDNSVQRKEHNYKS